MSIETRIENEGLGHIGPSHLGELLTAAEQHNVYGFGVEIVDFDESQLAALDASLKYAETTNPSQNVMRGSRGGVIGRLGSVATGTLDKFTELGGRRGLNPDEVGGVFNQSMRSVSSAARLAATGVTRAIRRRQPTDVRAVLEGFLASEAGSGLAEQGVRVSDIFDSLLYHTFEANLDLRSREGRLFNGILRNTIMHGDPAERAQARWNAAEIVAETHHMSPARYLVHLNRAALARKAEQK